MCAFGRRKEMKSILCKRKSGISFADRIQVVKQIKKEKQFEYLEPIGKIYCLRDLDFNVPLLHVEFEGWVTH